MSWLRSLGTPLVVGLAVRELLAPWTGHPFDFEIWVRLGYTLQTGGSPYSLLPYLKELSFAPYPVVTSISYPPLSAFMFALAYNLYQVLGSPSQFVYYFLLKQPTIAADVATSILLFKLVVLGGAEVKARWVASLWLYFPFAIIVSAMWGALDPLALLLILASLYAFKTRRTHSSAALLGVATFLKLMPIILLPVFLIQEGLSNGKRFSFSMLALLIPLVGTAVPVLIGGWGSSGVYHAVAYQSDLSAFGGMSIFLPLSLVGPLPGGLTQALGVLWVPALLIGYAFIYRLKMGLTQGLLLTVLLFSISRPALPEQWALYPMALLLINFDGTNGKHFVAITAAAGAFLAFNNFLLVRFFTPLSVAAFNWDQFIDNGSVLSDVRYAIMVTAATLFFAEAVSIIARRESILFSKFAQISSLSFKRTVLPLFYLAVVSITGGLLDFTVIGLVTNWAVAIESPSFLSLSPLSLYHIMLVVAYETSAVTLVLFSRRSVPESIDLLLLLTYLNIAASGLALVLFRVLDGTPPFTTTPIYLVGTAQVTERFFVVFTITIATIGLLFREETRNLVLLIRRGPGRLASTG